MDQERRPATPEYGDLEEEVREIFPTPGAAERVWLADALIRIRTDVDWLANYFGGEPDFRALNGLLKMWKEQVPPEQRRLQPTPFKGDFDAAGIMSGDHSPKQPIGLQVLRGLVWLVLRHKRRSNRPSASAVRDLAAALRAMWTPTTAAAQALGDVLPKLGKATSLDQAIEALSALAASSHRSLRDVWQEWLLPALRLLASEAPAYAPLRPDPPPRQRKTYLPADEEQERIETLDGPNVEPLVPCEPFPGQLPHEPAEEFGLPTYLVSLPGEGTGLPATLAHFYAQRAIWTGNGHLLTNHIDVLLPDVLGAVLRSIVARLEDPENDPATIQGSLGCLLKAVTGRTTAGIKAFRIGEAGHEGRIAGGVLDVEAALIWIPVFWKGELPGGSDSQSAAINAPLFSHFRPTPSQRPLLSAVGDRLALPLPTPVRDAFRLHKEALQGLTKVDAQVLDDAMRDEIARIGKELCVPLTIGSVRRCLGPLIKEQCGDQAMAQLICGESLGRTMATQSYYAPKMKAVAEVYAATFEALFGPSPRRRIPAHAARIGSELLVTPSTVALLASSSGRRVPDRTPVASERALLIQAHRAIADHLARMLLATTGHRPSEALFEMTRADVDSGSGAALFWDKRHDWAHDPRLACVPRVIADQISAYLDHVQYLQLRMPSLAAQLEEVLDGRSPLLFDLDSEGKIVRPTLAQVFGRGPEEWTRLPGNWSRTWIRTIGVESGAPSFLVDAQLGHYDAIGYPYSNQSPTEPLEVISQTRPWLDALAKRQGWSVLQSDLAKAAPLLAPREPPPLRDWTSDIDSAEASVRKARQAWVRRLKAERHTLRAESLAAVLSHALLTGSGLASAYQDPLQPVRAEDIELLDVVGVRDELVAACGDDAIAATARIRAINQVLRGLSKRADMPPPLLPVPVPVRRPLDNPFFRGACLALTQISSLRRHVQGRSKERAPKRTFLLQVARAAEALILFGGIDNAALVRAVLEARAKAVRSAKIVDLLLVPVAGTSVALRGIAALALANLASEFPDEPIPSDADVAQALQTLLPKWAADQSCSGRELILRLCSTAAVANRFEYSPAARFALDPEAGSILAKIDEQVAFVDADPVGPARPASADEDALPLEHYAPNENTPNAIYKSTPRRQYSQLTAMIPKRGKAHKLPFTGVEIPATSINTSATRDCVIKELEAWLAPSTERGDLWPVVRMLGEWTLSEAQRRKADGKRLADKSVTTYLTRIGSALVQVLGELEVSRWDERLLENAYSYALATSKDAKHKVASALLSFHRFCEFRFDLPDADLGDVYAALRGGERRVDAAMILPVERDQALARLHEKAWEVPSDERAGRRARLAEFIGIFVARTGARISEPLGVRVADIGLRPSGELLAFLRPNRMRRIKTEAGRRSTTFGDASVTEATHIWTWREDVRQHAPPGRADSAFLTAQLDDSRAFGEHGPAVGLVRSELALATGRSSERLHRLRHLLATERLMAASLSHEDAIALGLQPFAPDRPLQPRDFAAISMELGQAHWMTTIQWYLHMAWILQSRAVARISAQYFGRQAVAGALGYTPAFFDNLLRHGTAVSPKAAWFNRFLPARIPPPPRVRTEGHTASQWAWTARGVARLMTEAARCKDLESAIRLTGAPLDAVPTLTAVAGRWERKLGRRLIPPHVSGKQREAPGKALRRLAGDKAIEVLWDKFDDGDMKVRQDLLQIVNAMFVELIPGDGETLLLPRHEAHQLKDLLLEIGIPEENVRIDRAAHDLATFRAHHRQAEDSSETSVPYAMRRVLAVIAIAAHLQDAA